MATQRDGVEIWNEYLKLPTLAVIISDYCAVFMFKRSTSTQQHNIDSDSGYKLHLCLYIYGANVFGR